ncbi:MAG: c-type cytochrome [Betaproteobacteria bacterium]|nr:c-type cytochrome [Betaproteobacteria bacterium]MDH5220363.1 c-type cytochrome [Betaproteobacteria bacterium]MDH5349955.1 c-type cytochrome [Betaproteobacteria bacterium]
MIFAAISAAALALAVAAPAQASEALAKKYNCTACHAIKGAKTVGPTYADVAKKYAGQKGIEAKLAEKVKKGGTGVWGQVPMPPNPTVPDADLQALVKWTLSIK